MDLEPTQIALGFALALAVGGMVGLERERYAHQERRVSIGGARTFPLASLFGALMGLLASTWGTAVFVAGFGALAMLLTIGYWLTRGELANKRYGLTTELSALMVYVIGAVPFVAPFPLEFAQRLLLAGALGAVVMALLALRQPIHEFAEALSQEDLLATVRFALIAVVALPLLPDRSYGPYGALNPFKVGVVIVLIAGISFVGYASVRMFGARRGIGVTALAGGLVSSTAVTLTFSARSKEHRELGAACSLAITLAATVMFVRLMVEIVSLRPELARPAAAPLGAMLAVGVVGCLILWRRSAAPPNQGETKGFENPFRLRHALRLGLVYALVRLLAAFAWNRFGSGGLLLSAGLSGLADVDAITISIARMHAHGLDTDVAIRAVTVAAASNTLAKAAIAMVLGGRLVAVAVPAVFLPMAAVGALFAWLGI